MVYEGVSVKDQGPELGLPGPQFPPATSQGAWVALKTLLAKGLVAASVMGSLKVPTSLSCCTPCFPLGCQTPWLCGLQELGDF